MEIIMSTNSTSIDITRKKMELIEEQTSPLFRIMWVANPDTPNDRSFHNNICAFHIGQGYILSVAHNLRSEAGVLLSIDNNDFNNNLIPSIQAPLKNVFQHCYPLNSTTGKRNYKNMDMNHARLISDEFRRLKTDTRWITLDKKKNCTPFMIIQFAKPEFYNDTAVTALFSPNRHFPEPTLNRHTFLIEVELVEALYSNDIAIYKITNTDQKIINKIPSIPVDFELHDSTSLPICLQSAPSSHLGRLANEAKIEGHLEQWTSIPDRIGGDYIMEGLRYLIRGYFRFGSSGAPYLIYDEKSEKFKATAIQSEASPIQLSIGGNRDGNFQYVNAIATPLLNAKDKIESKFE